MKFSNLSCPFHFSIFVFDLNYIHFMLLGVLVFRHFNFDSSFSLSFSINEVAFKSCSCIKGIVSCDFGWTVHFSIQDLTLIGIFVGKMDLSDSCHQLWEFTWLFLKGSFDLTFIEHRRFIIFVGVKGQLSFSLSFHFNINLFLSIYHDGHISDVSSLPASLDNKFLESVIGKVERAFSFG